MIKVVGVFVGVVLGLGLTFAMIGDGLGKKMAQSVESDGSARQHQILVPKETMEQRRLRHMSYFNPSLYRRVYGQAY